MIDLGVIITGVIGLVTSITSGWLSYLFTRKKYNSEVDENVIHNMKESLEFYKQLSDDNKERLNSLLKRNDELESEIKELRKQVSELMLLTCKDLTCRLRQTNIDLLKSQNLLKAQNEKDT